MAANQVVLCQSQLLLTDFAIAFFQLNVVCVSKDKYILIQIFLVSLLFEGYNPQNNKNQSIFLLHEMNFKIFSHNRLDSD